MKDTHSMNRITNISKKVAFLSCNNHAIAHGSKLDPLPEKYKLASSVSDPLHFGVDPDPDLNPRIHASV
jgi:hypothetical protein